MLFGVKLYIGLSTNSIGIYSDAVNNLFDSLSGLLTFICMAAAMRPKDTSAVFSAKKTEQLCSFLMATVITFTGLYFAYSSLERFMYPTPVWYTTLYLGVLLGTACVKLTMFFLFRAISKKDSSPIIKLTAIDSLLDFGITCVTALTLWVSQQETFVFDAAAGLVISAVIVISATRNVISSGAKLINYVPKEKKDVFYEILYSEIPESEISSVVFLTEEKEITAYVTAKNDAKIPDETKKRISDNTGISTAMLL